MGTSATPDMSEALSHAGNGALTGQGVPLGVLLAVSCSIAWLHGMACSAAAE